MSQQIFKKLEGKDLGIPYWVPGFTLTLVNSASPEMRRSFLFLFYIVF